MQAIHKRDKSILDLPLNVSVPVSVGAISIVAVIVTVWATTIAWRAAAFCFLISWDFYSSSISVLKASMLTKLSNNCLACSITSMCIVTSSSSQLVSSFRLYFDSGGLLDVKFFLAKVRVTSFSFLLCLGGSSSAK